MSAHIPVDIGMPAFERPHFIGEALESALAQSHTNWTLTVSENGPGGGAVEAEVRKYTGDPRIRYSATGENLGPAANWTRLIRIGTAPYVTLLQDDDKWEPDFLAHRVAFLEQNPSCAFVFSGESKIDQHGRSIDIERTPSLPERDVADVLAEGVYPPREFLDAMYRNKLGGIHTPAICSVGVMSRRSALESVGATFDADYPYWFWDVELYLRMALRYPTGFLALADGINRIHNANLTTAWGSFDGEHWVRYHHYHREWFMRELPGLELPREFDELVAQSYTMAALDALEQGDRRKGARYLRGAARSSAGALLDPRVITGVASLLLGRLGTPLIKRARSLRRRRSDRIVYETQAKEA